MTDEKDIARLKREAAEKAKAAAQAKRAAKEAESAEESRTEEMDELAKAKAKAAAAAKAKAAAQAKRAAKEAQAVEKAATEESSELVKAKAAAAAKAKVAAAAKAKAARSTDGAAEVDKEKAKAAAIAKAKAAAAAKAKLKAKDVQEEATTTEPPSPNEPLLKQYVSIIESELGLDVLEDFYINKLSRDVPTLVAKQHTYIDIANLLKTKLNFHYLSELHGTDFETHMEIYVHLVSNGNDQSVVLKVSVNRENPSIPSLVPIWSGANWPECEAYDLLGIQFINHPDLKRIFLGEEWMGYPLRKDYKPYDVEV